MSCWESSVAERGMEEGTGSKETRKVLPRHAEMQTEAQPEPRPPRDVKSSKEVLTYCILSHRSRKRQATAEQAVRLITDDKT